MPHPTDWFHSARWGVFFHYLASPASSADAPDMSVDEWNRKIDGIDVETLARQLEETGAGYFFITLGQNSGFFLSPNKAWDRLVGRNPSRLSKRDLVADLYAAFDKRGIRLMVYLPSHAPAKDMQAVEGLACTPTWDPGQWGLKAGSYQVAPGTDERLSHFQRNWEEIIREWSMRWGKHVHGWWIDGCYYADKMYRHPEAPNGDSFAAAMRAGNPDSIVALNPGVKIPVIRHLPCEDYTAGEVANSLPVTMDTGRPATWAPTLSRFQDGAQYHLLTFLGHYWGKGAPRFSQAMLNAYTAMVNEFGGVITWDVPPEENGTIAPVFMDLLRGLGNSSKK